MNIWHDINPKQITTEEFIAVIEIPKNSKVKYELNKETGVRNGSDSIHVHTLSGKLWIYSKNLCR